MKKRDRWDGNSGKLIPFKQRRRNKRTSFILPPEKEDKGDCLPKDYNPRERTGNPIGRPRVYTPEQQYNYKSRYARYIRALDLKPAKISENSDGCTEYQFYSCNATTGFFTVEVCPTSGEEGTYIEAGEPITIICPPSGGYLLDQVDSDGTEFKWEQISGTRTVLFDDDSIKNPKILIQSSCFTSGCDDTSSLPIVLKVELANDPTIFDTLIIYNTITDTYYGPSMTSVSSSADSSDCRSIPCKVIPAPAYKERAYCDGSFTFTWELPTCEKNFIYQTAIQQNTTGQYIDAEVFDINDDRFFEATNGITYRIAARFNQFGSYSESFGCSFRFSGAEHTLFADNTYSGISATSNISNIENNIPSTKRLTINEDIYPGISSYCYLSNIETEIPTTKRLTINEDIYPGISGVPLENEIERFDLGSVVVG